MRLELRVVALVIVVVVGGRQGGLFCLATRSQSQSSTEFVAGKVARVSSSVKAPPRILTLLEEKESENRGGTEVVFAVCRAFRRSKYGSGD